MGMMGINLFETLAIVTGVTAMGLGAVVLAAGPAVVATHWLSRGREAALLVRGPLEQHCTVAAALFAALGTAGWILALLRGLSVREFVPGAVMLTFASPAIAVAPWVAGELLAGPSRRRFVSLGAAVVAAAGVCCGAAAAGAALHLEMFRADLLATAVLASVASCAAYRLVRGQPRTFEERPALSGLPHWVRASIPAHRREA